MTRFPLLDRETAAQAELPSDERMAHILEYRFCNYPAGDLVLDKLEILFYDEAPGRQLGLAILGESGLGKSYILKHFSDNLHPQFRTRDRGMPVRPVVYLELPAEFKLSDLQEQVLAALGATANGWRGSNRDLHIKRLVKDLCVRMFIFDDIQHFTNQSPLRTSRLFDWIKYLLNDLEIAVVVAGIPSASEALHKDPQISTRFEPLTMPAWDVNDAFGQFLGNFERTFPRVGHFRAPPAATGKREEEQGAIPQANQAVGARREQGLQWLSDQSRLGGRPHAARGVRPADPSHELLHPRIARGIEHIAHLVRFGKHRQSMQR
jgi:hypothetical protein